MVVLLKEKEDISEESWILMKKKETGDSVYLRYKSGQDQDAGKEDMYIDWEIRSMTGGLVKKSRLWCLKKDHGEVMDPEEMVGIVFGRAAGPAYRQIRMPLFLCA